MIQYTYDHETRTMMTMFLNSMSDIVVKRFNVHKEPRDQIKTRIVYAPKQRVLADLLDRDQNLKLPVIACYIGGISRDSSRVWNKIQGTYNVPNTTKTSVNEKTPLPIDLTINVSIMTRYQEDMDQIISHIIPYINPYFVVSWRTPKRPDFEIRSQVIWGGSINIQYPNDINSSTVARVVADLSFVFKGWIFQSAEARPSINNIYEVKSTFENITNIPSEFLLTEDITKYSDLSSSDKVFYDAVPPKPQLIQPHSLKVGTQRTFVVYGSELKSTKNIYLSGLPFVSDSILYDNFASYPNLSANNPPFFGIMLSSTMWKIERDSGEYLTFVMPSAASPGFVDVIIENFYGYGTLTKNVRVDTFNPFVPGTAKHSNFIPYQVPYLSGVEFFI